MSDDAPVVAEPSASITTKIQYADIISITAERNEALHGHMFYVDYIDSEGATLIDADTQVVEHLRFAPDGTIRDESITGITILSRAETPGFAANNDLDTGVWIDAHVGGDEPTVITGRITAKEEDMIEITAYPEGYAFYVDFAYKGMPKDLPFEKFTIRDPPIGALPSRTEPELELDEDITPTSQGDASVELSDDNEMVIQLPADYVPDHGVLADLEQMYHESEDIVFGEDLATLDRVTEVTESDKTYTVEAQLSSIEDELVASIPPEKLNERARARIRILVQRFRELRDQFSAFDDAGEISGARVPTESPLAEAIAASAVDIHWVVPVIAGRKKLYDLENMEEFTGDTALVAMDSKSAAEEMCSIFDDSVSKMHDYNRRLRAIDAATIPVFEPVQSQSVSAPKYATVQIETILENVEPLTTMVARTTKTSAPPEIARERFVTHVADGPITTLRVDAANKRKYTRVPLGTGDPMHITSVLTLPKRDMESSRAWLPSTDVLTRTNCAANIPYRFITLAPDTEVDSGARIPGSAAWTDKVRHTTPHSAWAGLVDAGTKLVSSALPSIHESIASFSTGAYFSVASIARALEVLMIYPEHFTNLHKDAIHHCIAASAARLNAALETTHRAVARIAPSGGIGAAAAVPNTLAQLIESDPTAREAFTKAYRRGNTATETMAEMHDSADSMRLFHALIRRGAAGLRLPSGMIGELADSYTIAETADKSNDCTRRVLTKRYATDAALTADNGRPVYYDKEFDDTPYDLLKIYPATEASTPAEFVDFLTKTLIKHHSVPPSRASRVAAAMVAKKKQVADGEFAVLEYAEPVTTTLAISNTPVTELHRGKRYFMRKNDQWMRDSSIDENAFFDTKALFCNMSANCVSVVTGTGAGETQDCLAIDDAKIRAQSAQSRAARTELDRRFDADADADIERENKDIMHLAQRVAGIRKAGATSTLNRTAYKLGLHAAMPVQNKEDEPLRLMIELILTETDFNKMNTDIVRLVEHGAFCRLPLLTVPELNEDAHWLYSVATNRKILPSFLYELALVHTSGGDYAKALDEICYTRGTVMESEIVDKYSGRVIKHIDDQVEDEYDEAGKKLITRSVMETAEDGANTAEEMRDFLKKTEPDIDDPDARQIHNIVMTLCANIGIDPALVSEQTIRIAKDAVSVAIPTRVAYERYLRGLAAKQSPEGAKAPETFEVYKGKRVIACAAAGLIVAIQTSIPSVPRGAPLPGCKMSFDGFPLSLDETDDRIISFIACVVSKSKSRTGIWSSIQTMTAEMLTAAIKFILTNYILQSSDVNGVADMYAEKRQYLTVRGESLTFDEAAATHDWPRFMPPIIPFAVSVQPVPDVARETFISALKRGDPEQRAIMAMFDNYVMLFSYAIIQSIHTAVTKRRDSFVYSPDRSTTSCCGDHSNTSTMDFFVKEDPAISKYLQSIRELAVLHQSVHDCDTAPSFFNSVAERVLPLPVQLGGYERNIYAMIIRYCKLDTDDPVPLSLRFVLQQRPKGYRADMSLDQKIELIKGTGSAAIGADDAQLIARVISKPSMVPIESRGARGGPVDALAEFLTHIAATDIDIIPTPLRDHITATIDQAPKGGARTSVRSRALDALTDYLVQTNVDMNSRILSFLKDHGAFSRAVEMRNIAHYMDTIHEWTDSEADESALFSSAQFLRNEIIAVCAIIPTQSMNGARPRAPPAHWDLAHRHEQDIAAFLADERIEINKVDTAILHALLREVQTRLRTLRAFSQLIPVSAPVKGADGRPTHTLFNATVSKLLLSWCWRAAIYEYMLTLNNPAVMRRDQAPIFTTMSGAEPVRMDMSTGDVWNTPVIEVEYTPRIAVASATAAFMSALIASSVSRKKLANVSWADIERNAYALKRADEKRITDRLGGDRAETAVQQELKKLRLGQWAMGATKSVYQYDKSTYGETTYFDPEDEDMEMELDPEGDDDAAVNDYIAGREKYAKDDDVNRAADREADLEYSFQVIRGDGDDGDEDGYEEYDNFDQE